MATDESNKTEEGASIRAPSRSQENHLGQEIGFALPDWRGASVPTREPMTGLYCRLEALRADSHAAFLHEAYSEDREGGNWTYLPYGPFESARAYHRWMLGMQDREDVIAFAIIDAKSDRPLGVATYLRIDPASGSIEVGHLSYAPALQRTPVSTEAMYLMMKRVFEDWGYRRYEWKCDSRNAPSKAAAVRLGFRYEGTFFNHIVMKGRNRDTSWLSILDTEWPARKVALETWLDAANFDDSGRQRESLATMGAPGRG